MNSILETGNYAELRMVTLFKRMSITSDTYSIHPIETEKLTTAGLFITSGKGQILNLENLSPQKDRTFQAR